MRCSCFSCLPDLLGCFSLNLPLFFLFFFLSSLLFSSLLFFSSLFFSSFLLFFPLHFYSIDGVVKHYMIEETANGMFGVAGKSGPFPSLEALVRHHQEVPISSAGSKLVFACPVPGPPTIVMPPPPVLPPPRATSSEGEAAPAAGPPASADSSDDEEEESAYVDLLGTEVNESVMKLVNQMGEEAARKKNIARAAGDPPPQPHPANEPTTPEPGVAPRKGYEFVNSEDDHINLSAPRPTVRRPDAARPDAARPDATPAKVKKKKKKKKKRERERERER